MTIWWFEILGVTAPWLMFTSAANLRIWWEVSSALIISQRVLQNPKNTSCWQIASPHRVYLYSFRCVPLTHGNKTKPPKYRNFFFYYYYRQVAVDKNCAQVTWWGTFLIVIFFCNTQTEMNACSLKSCDIKYLTFFFLSCFFYTEQNQKPRQNRSKLLFNSYSSIVNK